MNEDISTTKNMNHEKHERHEKEEWTVQITGCLQAERATAERFSVVRIHERELL